ncbi:flavin reductase family protein [Nocardioides sp.]|uniref:flavin reductase family protein n=1 Tax=Nocardioides sp. TaxID=35761 RepID=UPI002608FE47|nr:flavin reductase family protein [Nocardioides sp.]
MKTTTLAPALSAADLHAEHEAAFKRAMTRLPSPVTILTTVDESGRPVGATVGAVTSLSLSPLLLMVSLVTESRIAHHIAERGSFNLHVLEAAHAHLALRFGSPSQEKFDGIDWSPWHGLPLIAGAATHLHCSVHTAVELGDHTVYAATPLAIEISDAGAPLAYADRILGPIQR